MRHRGEPGQNPQLHHVAYVLLVILPLTGFPALAAAEEEKTGNGRVRSQNLEEDPC